MLAVHEDEMVETISFARLTDVAIAMEEWSAQFHSFNVERFFYL
jgi:hypothetical protein